MSLNEIRDALLKISYKSNVKFGAKLDAPFVIVEVFIEGAEPTNGLPMVTTYTDKFVATMMKCPQDVYDFIYAGLKRIEMRELKKAFKVSGRVMRL